jgi:hypothetical protein
VLMALFPSKTIEAMGIASCPESSDPMIRRKAKEIIVRINRVAGYCL